MWMLKRRKFDGQVFGAFMFIYGTARFFLEDLRDDPGRGSVFGGAITGTQLIAIGLEIGGGLIWWLRPRPKRVPAQTLGATRQRNGNHLRHSRFRPNPLLQLPSR